MLLINRSTVPTKLIREIIEFCKPETVDLKKIRYLKNQWLKFIILIIIYKLEIFYHIVNSLKQKFKNN